MVSQPLYIYYKIGSTVDLPIHAFENVTTASAEAASSKHLKAEFLDSSNQDSYSKYNNLEMTKT